MKYLLKITPRFRAEFVGLVSSSNAQLEPEKYPANNTNELKYIQLPFCKTRYLKLKAGLRFAVQGRGLC